MVLSRGPTTNGTETMCTCHFKNHDPSVRPFLVFCLILTSIYNDLIRMNDLVSYLKCGDRTNILVYSCELERKADAQNNKPKTTITMTEITELMKGRIAQRLL